MDYSLNIEPTFKCLEIYHSPWCGIISISYIIHGDKNTMYMPDTIKNKVGPQLKHS